MLVSIYVQCNSTGADNSISVAWNLYYLPRVAGYEMKRPLCAKRWDKIRLENLIFARARQERKKVWARQGRLYVDGSSAYLRALLRIYAVFFQEENLSFLREDELQTFLMCAVRKEEFERERKKNPLFSTFYLSAQDKQQYR